MNVTKEDEIREETAEERLTTLEERLTRIYSILLGPIVKEQNKERDNSGVIAALFWHLDECDNLVNQIENIVNKIRN